MFYTILSKKLRNYKFSLTRGNWIKSATVITERAVNAFSRIIIIIYPNLGSLSVRKSLVTIESSSIINNFTSDNLFLKSTWDLSFKPSNFVPGLIPRPE